MNFVQLAIFGIGVGFLRNPSIARWISKHCSVFPSTPERNFEPLSIIDWVAHYSINVYGLGVLQEMLIEQKGAQQQPRPRRKSLSLVFAMQQFMGLIVMLSHSLVDKNTAAEHALLDFGYFILQISNFATGFVVLFPFYGWVTLLPIAHLVLKEEITFKNVSGIVLNTFALLSILASPKNDFPLLFKLSFVFMSLMPVVALKFDTSTDFGHTMASSYLSAVVVLMRASLQNQASHGISAKKHA